MGWRRVKDGVGKYVFTICLDRNFNCTFCVAIVINVIEAGVIVIAIMDGIWSNPHWDDHLFGNFHPGEDGTLLGST